MNEFKNYHPIVNFIYFTWVIACAMYFMHPLCLMTAFVSSIVYSVILNGTKAVRFDFLVLLPMLCMAAMLNPAFNHEGATMLAYLPSGNPLTAEAIFYGVAAAVMIASVICYFSCVNKVMTSDKLVYLFGKMVPSLSLMLSMILRFTPRFKAQIRRIAVSQRCVGRDVSQGSLMRRAKNGITILSVMITWALENSIDTARSMKSRGYGLKGRTSFSIFSFGKRDKRALMYMTVLLAYVIIGAARGCMYVRYYPTIKTADVNAYSVSVYAAYFMLCMLPAAIEITERIRWNAIELRG